MEWHKHFAKISFGIKSLHISLWTTCRHWALVIITYLQLGLVTHNIALYDYIFAIYQCVDNAYKSAIRKSRAGACWTFFSLMLKIYIRLTCYAHMPLNVGEKIRICAYLTTLLESEANHLSIERATSINNVFKNLTVISQNHPLIIEHE